MVFLSLGEDAAGALGGMLTVMADPGFAENLTAEALGVGFVVGVVGVFRVGLAGFDVESVGGGADADDRLAGLQIGDDVLHLIVGQVAKAGENHHQVG